MALKHCVIVLIYCCLGAQAASLVTQNDEFNGVRLPRSLIPISYKLELVPFVFPGNFTVRGHVEIEMRCERNTRVIILHAMEMGIDYSNVKVLDMADNEFVILHHSWDFESETYMLVLQSDLAQGNNYKLRIPFVSILNDGLKGFYRSTYKNELGEEEYIAVTQFESTFARKAFPCFDEPDMKARFEVSLGRTKDMISLSNMPIKDGQKGVPMEGTEDYVWDHYEESVPMSTYLVAFIICKFGYKESELLDNNVRFRIWARKTALDQVAYADSIGARILKYFEEYFDIEYPLPKQDMIAIPDFNSGAMENWGLITYRETALLYKPGVSSSWNKQRVAIVISHELAHQWFGNLVTMKWWDDLWLNEGFASYVEYLGVDAVEPSMRIMDRFVTTDLQSVMRLDCLDNSHPVSVKVRHPHEIVEIFDGISYSKGATIIRMMSHFLTQDTFRNGVNNYLRDLKYKSATQDNLWHFLTDQAHKDHTLPRNMTVKEIMDTWTLQMGFPVVTVERNYETGCAYITQKKFTLGSEIDEKTKWWVPLTYTFGDRPLNTYPHTWMSPKGNQAVKVGGLPRDRTVPVIFNVEETGYYRVNYDQHNWKLISDTLLQDHTSVNVINRAQIVDDAMNLARAGETDYKIALQIITYLRQELSNVPWRAGRASLSYLDSMLVKTEAFGPFRAFMRTMVRDVFHRLSTSVRSESESEEEEFNNARLRVDIYSLACAYQLPECCNMARKNFLHWMQTENPDSENPMGVEYRSVNYCTSVMLGGEEEWDFVWKRFLKANVASERVTLLRALSCTRETWLLTKLLKLSITPNSGIRKQDVGRVFSSVASNELGKDLVFDFAREHWNHITRYLGSGSVKLLSAISKDRNTPLELKELKHFRDNFKFLGSTKSLDIAIEKTELNILWMNRHYELLHQWFQAYAENL